MGLEREILWIGGLERERDILVYGFREREGDWGFGVERERYLWLVF